MFKYIEPPHEPTESLEPVITMENRLPQHIVYRDAKNTLCASEARVLSLLLSLTAYGDQETAPVNMPPSRLMRLLNISSVGGRDIKSFTSLMLRLPQKTFDIYETPYNCYSYHWLSLASQLDNGCLSLQLDPALLKFVQVAQTTSKYTAVQLSILTQLSRKHSWDLYLLCKSAAGLDKWKMGINNLKERLGAQRVKEFDLRRNILDPCLAEISAKTDIIASYKLQSANRRTISSIEFLIAPKEDLQYHNKRLFDRKGPFLVPGFSGDPQKNRILTQLLAQYCASIRRSES